MQKGEWLPFSRLFSFCILHFHSWGQAPSPLGQGEGEWGSRRFHGLTISEPCNPVALELLTAAWVWGGVEFE